MQPRLVLRERRSRSAGFIKGPSRGREARLLELREPMQKSRAEQNERRTLQRKFDVRPLKERERTPELFSGSCVRTEGNNHNPL